MQQKGADQIRVRCPGCQKVLGIKASLAGKRVLCPGCKKPLTVPAPRPAAAPKPSAPPQAAYADELAANILAQTEAAEAAARAAQKIQMTCPWCDEQIQFDPDLAGKQAPCPECKRIIKVEKPKDAQQHWRESRAGPQFTKENLEQKIEDAWGTATDQAMVHKESMAKAGALPEPVRAPVGVGGWVRRGLIAGGAIVMLVVLILFGLTFLSQRAQQANLYYAQEAYKALEKKKGNDPMPLPWKAEFQRAAGLFHARDGNPVEAKDSFLRAQFQFPPNVSLPSEQELLLIDLALAQLELGGSEQQAIDGVRLRWNDVVQDVARTLMLINSTEGRLFGLRRACLALRHKGEKELALSLATQITRDTQPETGEKHSAPFVEQFAMMLALKHSQQARNLLAPPTDKQPKLDLIPGQAYAEGLAHEGNFVDARRLAQRLKVNYYRVQALLAVADIAREAGNTQEAKASLDEALAVATNDLRKSGIPPLIHYQIVWAVNRLDSPQKGKEWADLIGDAGCKGLALLDVQQASGAGAIDPAAISTAIGDKNNSSLAYARAALLKARYDSAWGSAALRAEKDRLHPLIYVGLALGQQD